MSGREIYRRNVLSGFQSSKVETVSCSNDGRRLFCGASDGSISYYECSKNGSASNAYFDCHLVETVRRPTREKKPITSLRLVESWNIIMGICDSYIIAYDMHTFAALNQMPETKGTTLYDINEKSCLLCWQSGLGGFVLRREVSYPESPRTLLCISGTNNMIVGLKKHYEILDLQTYNSSKIIEFEKEHRLVAFEIPVLFSRNRPIVILSTGLQGVVMDAYSNSSSAIISHEERIEWATPPLTAQAALPFILSLLLDSIEVHDIISLTSLQRIRFVTPAFPTSMCLIPAMTGAPSAAFISTAETVVVMTMVPLSTQVTRLVEGGNYEDALALTSSCLTYGGQPSAQLADVDIRNIHERYGTVLYQKGDFDGAVVNYLSAESDIVDVFTLFPELVPQGLLNTFFPQKGNGSISPLLTSMGVSATAKLQGAILHRAAAALVQFCEKKREKTSEDADRSESRRRDMTPSVINQSDRRASFLSADTTGTEYIDEVTKRSILLDTVLIHALIFSSPHSANRRNSVVEVLSGKNRCHIESCAVLLASQGNTFTEALLWLYRSHGEHKKVLSALSEERCVGTVWSRDSYYQWVAEYLQWLWYHEDMTLPPLILPPLKSVLEYNATLGLSILIHGGGRKYPTVGLGGKGVAIPDLISFFESIRTVGLNSPTTPLIFPVSQILPSSPPFPLLNGVSVSLIYLEWLVGSSQATPDTLDLYAQSLMKAIPISTTVDHNKNNLTVNENDSGEMKVYKIYRLKLQLFLQSSLPYRVDRIMKYLPKELLHEYALLLSRLGSHEEVLMIYVHQLQETEAAELYCDRIYNELTRKAHTDSLDNTSSMVYLCLLKVQLSLSSPSLPNGPVMTPREALNLAITTAEKYCDRLNPCDVLDIMPPSAPLAMLQNFLGKSIEYANSRKRNLQVLHQLLRVHEVNLRTSDQIGNF